MTRLMTLRAPRKERRINQSRFRCFGQWDEGDQKKYLSLREFKKGETGGKAETKASPPPKDESVFEDDDMPF